MSKFIAHDPNAAVHNHEIEKATRYLQEVIVPETAGRLDVKVAESIKEGSLLDLEVTEIIHTYGVNVRYLGLLYKFAKNESARSLLLIEMVKRVLKIYINQQIRTLSKRVHVIIEEPTRLLVTDILNRVFGLPSNRDSPLWRKVIATGLLHTFSLKIAEILASTLKSKVLEFKIHDPFIANAKVDLDTALQMCEQAGAEIHHPQLAGVAFSLTIQNDELTKHCMISIPVQSESPEPSKSTRPAIQNLSLTLTEKQFSKLMTGKITWKLLSEEVDFPPEHSKVLTLLFYELLPLVVQEAYMFCPGIQIYQIYTFILSFFLTL